MVLIGHNWWFKKKVEKDYRDPSWLALCVYGNLGQQDAWCYLPGMAKALAEEMNIDLAEVEYELLYNYSREVSVFKAGKLIRTYMV
jgi:hypothetical protein